MVRFTMAFPQDLPWQDLPWYFCKIYHGIHTRFTVAFYHGICTRFTMAFTQMCLFCKNVKLNLKHRLLLRASKSKVTVHIIENENEADSENEAWKVT